MELITFPPVDEPEADSSEVVEFKKRVAEELTSPLLDWEDVDAAINKVLIKLGIRKEPEEPVTVRLTIGFMGPSMPTQTDVKIVPSELRNLYSDEQAAVLAKKVELSIGGHPYPLAPSMILSAEVVKEIPVGWLYTSDQGQVLHYFPALHPDYPQYTILRSPYAECGSASYTPQAKSKRGTGEFCKRCLAKQPIN